jgi:YesN/AraC family two-component response regulator
MRMAFSREMGENIPKPFPKLTGFWEWLYVYKMKTEAAKKLLAGTHLSAGEIAKKPGFYKRQNFCRFFKKFESMTPNEFRQLY